MITTPNMALKAWNLDTDTFDPAQLVQDLLTIDGHDHTQGNGAQIPTGGLMDGAVTTSKIATGAVGSAQIANGAVGAAQLATSIASGLIPPGAVFPFAGTSLPAGYLYGDGSAVSRFTYAGLFSVLGTTYGIGDGTNTFNLPNLTQRIPLGLGSSGTGATLGEVGGALDHTHGADVVIPPLTVPLPSVGVEVALPSHTHGLSANGGAALGILYDPSVSGGGGLSPAAEFFWGQSTATFNISGKHWSLVDPLGSDAALNHGNSWPGSASTPGISLLGASDSGGSGVAGGATGPGSATSVVGDTATTTTSNNPPYITLHYIVKY